MIIKNAAGVTMIEMIIIRKAAIEAIEEDVESPEVVAEAAITTTDQIITTKVAISPNQLLRAEMTGTIVVVTTINLARKNREAIGKQGRIIITTTKETTETKIGVNQLLI